VCLTIGIRATRRCRLTWASDGGQRRALPPCRWIGAWWWHIPILVKPYRNFAGSRRLWAKFGRYAFNETDLLTIVTKAARICAASLDAPFCEAVSQADETSAEGHAAGRPEWEQKVLSRLAGCLDEGDISQAAIYLNILLSFLHDEKYC
jgi:hypothetical protein